MEYSYKMPVSQFDMTVPRAYYGSIHGVYVVYMCVFVCLWVSLCVCVCVCVYTVEFLLGDGHILNKYGGLV